VQSTVCVVGEIFWRRELEKVVRKKRLLFFDMSRIDYSKWDNLDYSSSDEEERRNEEINKIETKLLRDVEGLLLPQRTISSSPLWNGLVLHHRDIFVSHVLPKLNGTDRYFFLNANRESLDVLAYAGVDVSKLEWLIYECASISTLEFAWNNENWGEKDVNQAMFCSLVAHTNKLELLKWAREVKHCKWDEQTIQNAACVGNLEMLKYCFDNGCPYDERSACAAAAAKGHLECLQFLFDKVKPLQETVQLAGEAAAYHDNVDILKYIVETNNVSERVKNEYFASAAEWGHLDCLKYLVEEAKMPLNHWRYIALAQYFEHLECIDYLRGKEFPEPTDEQYAMVGIWYEGKGIKRGARSRL
jgi:hypothetical protein